MRVVVIGAGIAGTSTAYYLARDGHEVTVVDRHGAAAQETSFANGAQLSYSYVAPFAGPDVPAKLPFWLLNPSAPARFSPSADPAQWRWVLSFLMACTREASDRTTRDLLSLSFLSRSLMAAFLAEEPDVAFDHAPTGKLIVHSDAAGFESAKRQMDYQASLGCEQEALDRAACLTLEPALAALGERIVGGIFTRSEATADCRKLCEGLAAAVLRQGGRFRYNADVTGFVRQGERITAVRTSQGEIPADAVVVAAGTDINALLRPLGFTLPIHALKGYSVTAPMRPGVTPLKISVTDFANKIVYAPLGGTIRAAGFADISADPEPSPSRVRQLRRQAMDGFGALADFSGAEVWCGRRPATPTGRPLLGRSPVANLHLCAGLGGLGFTLGFGAGRLIADLLVERPAAIPMDGFRLAA
ncbi:D-amino acid dehydrogenase [Azospirillum thermophilum]|uniref:D-amino acid dehydrogenase small subunit n=1 Tax=Azospirillum thermophilum TaxID=2202148 RepID=A0A2S2CW91_9PROT|nr:D-amino acid dehydrogenase [Azospirillum thermophilum]AWK88739.1 D-amino acid dehydrogenase small subunit [Azospirillum thermophilum]